MKTLDAAIDSFAGEAKVGPLDTQHREIIRGVELFVRARARHLQNIRRALGKERSAIRRLPRIKQFVKGNSRSRRETSQRGFVCRIVAVQFVF